MQVVVRRLFTSTHSAPMPLRKMGLFVKRLLPSTRISAFATSSGMVIDTVPVDSTLYFTIPLNEFCAWAPTAASISAAAKTNIFFIFLIILFFIFTFLVPFLDGLFHTITQKT